MEDFGVIATRILALEKEKERLSCELEIIHKSGLLQQLPTSMRVEQVKALSTIYTAKLACRALEIKSATYYARKRHTATAKDKRDNEIRALINKIYEDSHRRFGSEKIRICLRTYGYNVGKKKIIVLMKELGIFQLSNASVVYKVDSLNRLEESSTYVSIL